MINIISQGNYCRVIFVPYPGKYGAILFCYFVRANFVRDISNGHRRITGNANHLGIQKKMISSSSMSYINEQWLENGSQF